MDRVFKSGASATAPAAPASPSTGFPTAGNPSTGTPPTKPGPYWYYMITESLRKFITDAGLTPDHADLNLLSQAIQSGAMWACQAVGSADALVGAFTPAVPTVSNGMSLRVRASVANGTTTPTFTPNGAAIAPAAIVKGADTPLVPGDIAGPGHWLDLEWDLVLGKWVLLNPAKGIVGSSVPVGTSIICNSNEVEDGYVKENGAALSRTVYAALFAKLVKSSNVTVSIASPGVVTWNNHKRSANDVIKLGSTGALPTGLTGGTTYYVVGASITANTFQLSATPGGAAIATSGGQTGTHTAIHAPHGDGDGVTTFNVPDKRASAPRGYDDGLGVDVNRVFGSLQLDAMQGHIHFTNAYSHTNNYTQNGGGSSLGGSAINTTGPISDGSNGTPRTASETRMRNTAVSYQIKY